MPAATKKSSTVMKLVQAAALAAALVPLGSVAMEGATLTCGFSGAPEGSCEAGAGFDTQEYNFGDYKLIVQFFGMDEAFTLAITDTPISQDAFDLRNAVEGNYDCVSLVAPTLTDLGVATSASYHRKDRFGTVTRFNTVVFRHGDRAIPKRPGQHTRAPGSRANGFAIRSTCASQPSKRFRITSSVSTLLASSTPQSEAEIPRFRIRLLQRRRGRAPQSQSLPASCCWEQAWLPFSIVSAARIGL